MLALGATGADDAAFVAPAPAGHEAAGQAIRIGWRVFLTGFVALQVLLSAATAVQLTAAATLWVACDQGVSWPTVAIVLVGLVLLSLAAGWTARAFLEYRRWRLMLIGVAVLALAGVAAARGFHPGILPLSAGFVLLVVVSLGRRFWLGRA